MDLSRLFVGYSVEIINRFLLVLWTDNTMVWFFVIPFMKLLMTDSNIGPGSGGVYKV